MKTLSRAFVWAAPVVAILLIGGCNALNGEEGDSTNETQETGQQIGDKAASMDEALGGGSRMLESARRTFARLSPGELVGDPTAAERTSCLFNGGFSACPGAGPYVRTLTLGGCTLLGATFTGSISLTFNDTACQFDSTGDTISRAPDYTITGLFGGTFTVSKTGTNGDTVTKSATADTAVFTNDGTRRAFAKSGTTLFDFTTTTTSDITVTNTTNGLAVRDGRVVNGGTLHLVNNLTAGTCDLSPDNLTWSDACNCPTSGSVTGTCTAGTGTVAFTSTCGVATVTLGSVTQTVILDRCHAIVR